MKYLNNKHIVKPLAMLHLTVSRRHYNYDQPDYLYFIKMKGFHQYLIYLAARLTSSVI
jgi:hypothetical protein